MPLALLFQKILPPFLGTERCPAAALLQTWAGLQPWECSACSGRERTTVTQELHIFPPYVAEISLPACAMLCCSCLSSSLGFSFADGFPFVPFGGDTGAFGWHFHALLAFSSGGFLLSSCSFLLLWIWAIRVGNPQAPVGSQGLVVSI